MITNRTFSPILYGAALVATALASGAYVQSSGDPERRTAMHLSGDASLLALRAATSGIRPTPVEPGWTTELTALTVMEGPNGRYRGLQLEILPDPCGAPATQGGCAVPVPLHAAPGPVILPGD